MSRGLFAIVDEEDFEFLDKFTWSAKQDGRTFYAVTNVNKVEHKMHKVVMRVNVGEDITIDHINGSGLTNTKDNLQIVSRSENQEKRRKKTKLKNRFIGVLPGLSGGFTVWFALNGKKTKKNFQDELTAARYYDYLTTYHKGAGAKTNLSDGRFTQAELDSFGGEITNPLFDMELEEGIKFSRNMVCLSEEEFRGIVHRLAVAEAEVKKFSESRSND